jgi:toxin secretion/phage lysis holin
MTTEQTQFTASMLTVIKWLFSILVALWANISSVMHMLVMLMCMDFVSGLVVAILSKTLNSTKSFQGITKKVLTLLLVTAANYVTALCHIPFDVGAMVGTAYCVNELISLTENCSIAGVPIPPAFIDILLHVKHVSGRNRTDVVSRLEDDYK